MHAVRQSGLSIFVAQFKRSVLCACMAQLFLRSSGEYIIYKTIGSGRRIGVEREVMALHRTVLTKCLFRSGVPHLLDDDKWPLLVLFSPCADRPNDLNSQLRGRPWLLLCSSLGDHTPNVPRSVLEKFLVVLVKNYTGEDRYGFRGMKYNDEDHRTFLTPWTDDDAVAHVWSSLCLMKQRFQLGSEVVIIGVSAGGDKALSLLAGKRQHCKDTDVRVSYLLIVATCDNEGIYEPAMEQCIHDNTSVLVHHHTNDVLCPWPPVYEKWCSFERRLENENSAALYMNIIDIPVSDLFGNKYHSIDRYLLSQHKLWYLLLNLPDQLSRADFKEYCSKNKLGRSFEYLRGDPLFSDGHSDIIEKQCHFIGLTLCAYYSSHSSKGPTTTDTMRNEPCRWLESMIRCARAWDMQQHKETVSKLSRSFGSYTGLSITIPMCFSYCWAEALCAVTNSNPIREKDVLLKQPKFLCSIPHKQEGVPIPSVALSLLWSSGPVVHLEICFEWFIDVAWTHFVDRINEHCYSFRPVFS